ncbi:MAG: hypothetical protein ACE366_11080 [Bradymonadia bacterium]
MRKASRVIFAVSLALWGCGDDVRTREPDQPDNADGALSPDVGTDITPDAALTDADLSDAGPPLEVDAVVPDAEVPCTCPEFENAPCQVGQCIDGQCVVRPRVDGTPCDDSDPETMGDRCVEGVCEGGRVLPDVVGTHWAHRMPYGGSQPIEIRHVSSANGVMSVSPGQMAPQGQWWTVKGGGIVGRRQVPHMPHPILTQVDFGGSPEPLWAHVPHTSFGKSQVLEDGQWLVGAGPWLRIDPAGHHVVRRPLAGQAGNGTMAHDGQNIAWVNHEGPWVASLFDDGPGRRLDGPPHDMHRHTVAMQGRWLVYTTHIETAVHAVVVDLQGMRPTVEIPFETERVHRVSVDAEAGWAIVYGEEEALLLSLGEEAMRVLRPRGPWNDAAFFDDGSAVVAIERYRHVVRFDLTRDDLGEPSILAMGAYYSPDTILHLSETQRLLWFGAGNAVSVLPLDAPEPTTIVDVPADRTQTSQHQLCGLSEKDGAFWFSAPTRDGEHFELTRVPLDGTAPSKTVIEGRQPRNMERVGSNNAPTGERLGFCMATAEGVILGMPVSIDQRAHLVVSEGGVQRDLPGTEGVTSNYLASAVDGWYGTGAVSAERFGVLTDGAQTVFRRETDGELIRWDHHTDARQLLGPVGPTPYRQAMRMLPDGSGVFLMESTRVEVRYFDDRAPIVHVIERLPYDSHVASPSGWRVAWAESVESGQVIYVMDLRTGRMWQHAGPSPEATDVPLGFLDESQLVFSRWSNNDNEVYWPIHVVDLETGVESAVLDGAQGYAFQGVLAGQMVLMSPQADGELSFHTYSLDTDDTTRLFSGERMDDAHPRSLWTHITPEEHVLVADLDRRGAYSEVLSAQSVGMLTDDGLELVSLNLPEATTVATPLLRSDEGSRLFAVAGAPELDVYALDLEGGSPQLLTPADGRSVWPVGLSSDGRWLAIATPIGLGSGVALVDLDNPDEMPFPVLWSEGGDVRFEGFLDAP